MSAPKIDWVVRFWRNVLVIEDANSCWPWVPCGSDNIYGKLGIDGKTVAVHRLAYKLSRGSIDESLDVLHTCDFKPCVRPDHLYQGTQQDNNRDIVERNRQPFGNANGMRLYPPKLNMQMAEEIRALKASGQFTQTEIAVRFNVSPSMIHYVLAGKAWS